MERPREEQRDWPDRMMAGVNIHPKDRGKAMVADPPPDGAKVRTTEDAWILAGADPEPKAPSAKDLLTLEVDVTMDTASYHVSRGRVSLGKVSSWRRMTESGAAERVYQARDMAGDEVGGEHLILDDAVAALVTGTLVAVKVEFRG